MALPGSRDERTLDVERIPAGEPRARLEFRSESLAEPFQSQFESDVTIDVDAIVKLADGGHIQYWTITGGTVGSLVAATTEFPTVVDVRLLSTNDDLHRLEVLGSEESLFSAINDFDGVTQAAVYDEDGVRIIADFPLPLDTDVIEAAVQEVYAGLELVSATEVEPIGVVQSVLWGELTDRQLTALQLAYFGGYFEQPRQSTGAELADRMGISKQAFHEHLRKAYRTVFERFFESTGGEWGVDP